MTEQEINKLLIQGRKASDYQLKMGNKQLAEEILQLTSKYCSRMIRLYKLNGEVTCKQCHRSFNKDIERDYIREYGFCLGCDALYAELMMDKAIEREEEDELLIN